MKTVVVPAMLFLLLPLATLAQSMEGFWLDVQDGAIIHMMGDENGTMDYKMQNGTLLNGSFGETQPGSKYPDGVVRTFSGWVVGDIDQSGSPDSLRVHIQMVSPNEADLWLRCLKRRIYRKTES